MRFKADGPSIPDELLTARDEGRVVFFCGAGVSRARAELPNFVDLADRVLDSLGAPEDSSPRKVLNEAKLIGERTGENGLISIDHVFGLLERDFLVRDIEAATISILKPKRDADTSAHKIIRDLATTPEGKLRLVTTNFDRLFEDSTDPIAHWIPPKLPDPSNLNEIDGIVYLHGCANKEYTEPESDSFVLSSSDFGKAYLSDGWATDFFKEVTNKFIVVFIGYAADDPPIRYLLEALSKDVKHLKGLYAFESEESGAAVAAWRHKGVTAIPYASADNHTALWETLELWATRARNPLQWHNDIIKKSLDGPKLLSPFERGQVAHIAASVFGAKLFSQSDPAPPAEWLCVFDKRRRFHKPGYVGRFDAENRQFIDPFDYYGLDCDDVPQRISPENRTSATRIIPSDAWDAFATTRLEQIDLDKKLPLISGGIFFNGVSKLPPRLSYLAAWLNTIADQPTAIWWAAQHGDLHPNIKDRLEWRIIHQNSGNDRMLRQAWRYLSEAWEHNSDKFTVEFYGFKSQLSTDGWNDSFIRYLGEVIKPYMKVGDSYWTSPLPPSDEKDIELNDLIHLGIEYPDLSNCDIEIPEEWLASFIRMLKHTIDQSIQLEKERGFYRFLHICSLIPEDNKGTDGYERQQGLSGYVTWLTTLYERLVEYDLDSALSEFNTWPVNEKIYSNLIVWAAGNAELISGYDAATILADLNEDSFWEVHSQRDLLIVIAKRWSEFNIRQRKCLEKRLLNGRPKWEGEDESDYSLRRSRSSLNRIQWLSDNGCDFTFKFDYQINKLKKFDPEWKPEYGACAADSTESRGGLVTTVTDHTPLNDIPLNQILSEAVKHSGREDGFLVEKDPFSGLCTDQPIKGFTALSLAAKNGEFPEWAWRTFLNAEERPTDTPRLMIQIAKRIASYPTCSLKGIVYYSTYWLSRVAKSLSTVDHSSFDAMVNKSIEIINEHPEESSSAIVRGSRDPDWVSESLNSPLGRVAESLLHDTTLDRRDSFPESWMDLASRLLTAGNDDTRRHACVRFSHHLNFFYIRDKKWTENNLFPFFTSKVSEDVESFWAGFLWRAECPYMELFDIMKPHMFAFILENSSTSQKYLSILAGIVLLGWRGTGEKCEQKITDTELRALLLNSAESFRLQILWELRKWAKPDEEDSKYKEWQKSSVELLKNVWPRQKTIKTAKLSSQLCEFAFWNPEIFSELVDELLTLCTTINSDNMTFPRYRGAKETILEEYPEQILAILYKVLPDDTDQWPYDANETLDAICEAKSNLSNDPRMLELKRRWNAR